MAKVSEELKGQTGHGRQLRLARSSKSLTSGTGGTKGGGGVTRTWELLLPCRELGPWRDIEKHRHC